MSSNSSSSGSLVTAERHALADALLAAGAAAPTLCEGWDVTDLAVHLVVRERRPDASLGLLLPPLAGHTARVSAGQAAAGLDAVVERFRSGPPPWSPFALPGVEGLANLAEFVVHHEDVRRAAGAGPRPDVPELQEAVWQRLPGVALMTLARTRVPVVAVHADGRRRVLWRGPHPVVLTGEPIELLLLLFGRRAVAQVDVGGPSLSVTRFRAASQGV
ncbi:TIGR03085 family metal-binding protein [Jannaschia sp. R86511]|uniref:TIGR03085 family metal-binding protein n=1 Tax=Jannaschia sp. R86511 TaxID=3093853 RepID=UPI0036D341AF